PEEKERALLAAEGRTLEGSADRTVVAAHPRAGWRWSFAAFVWGLAEATLFFVVPDVFLTVVALARPSRLVRCCLWAAAGASLGGAIVMRWAAMAPESATHAMLALPAISPGLI